MAKVQPFDMTEFRNIQAHGVHLRQSYQGRNKILNEMEDMFLMRWRRGDKMRRANSKMRVTVSPDARNAALGAVRLLTAADPLISVPVDQNDADAVQVGEKIEVFGKALWGAAGRVAGNPIHYDLVLSAILFGQMEVGITSTADLVAAAAGGSKASMRQAEEVAKRTPYLFDVFDPRQCFPERNNLGVRAYYRETKRSVLEIRDEWGDACGGMFTEKEAGYNEWVTFCDYWTYGEHVVWIAGKERPLLMEEHDLPFIPYVSHWVEGSTRLFEDEATAGRDVQYLQATQVQPFLYTLFKSGLWDNRTLALSVLYTNIFGIGSFPMFTHTRSVPDQPMNLDFNTPGGVVHLNPGEKVEPFIRQTVDPAIVQGLQLAEQQGEESTLYKTALGSPVGSDTYSTVALLNQAGRLPLVTAQRKASWVVGECIEKAVLWVKLGGGNSVRYGEFAGELMADDVPDRLQVEAKLDIALPQDKLQRTNTALAVVGGENPLASKRWARENILNIPQSDKMDEEVWEEKAADLQARLYFENQVKVMMARAQGGQGTGDGGPQTDGGQGGGGGITPEMLAMMQAQGGAGGMPMPEGMVGPGGDVAGNGMPLGAPLPLMRGR